MDAAVDIVRENLIGPSLTGDTAVLTEAYLAANTKSLRKQLLSGLAATLTIKQIRDHVDASISRRM